METAAHHFSTLAEQAPESVRPTRDVSDDVIEYRVSRKALDRLRESMRGQVSQPAERS
jgi:hypothetical protein